MMLGIVISDGDGVTTQGVVRCEAAVTGKIIAAVTAHGTLTDEHARRVITQMAHERGHSLSRCIDLVAIGPQRSRGSEEGHN